MSANLLVRSVKFLGEEFTAVEQEVAEKSTGIERQVAD